LIDEQLSEIASEIIYTNLGVLHSWDNDSKTKNSEFEKYFSLLVKNQTDNKLLSFALDDTVFRPLQPKLRKAKLNNFLAKAIVSPVPNTLTKKKAGSISADSGYQQQTVSKIYNNAVQSVVTILTEDGQGTGFVVSDKAILTNYHVIKGNSIVQLILNDGREILGKIGNFIPNSDIALIHPLRGALPSSLKMSTKRIQVGDPVLAIGSPSGLTGTLTNGIVSSLRNIKGVSYIQSNVAINPGNSGGPLLNMAGEVIGINTSKIIDESVEGLSFSVATEDFINLINQ
jgi:S1-C subfamily serine protease